MMVTGVSKKIERRATKVHPFFQTRAIRSLSKSEREIRFPVNRSRPLEMRLNKEFDPKD
jgi:hypothetical protein